MNMSYVRRSTVLVSKVSPTDQVYALLKILFENQSILLRFESKEVAKVVELRKI